MAFYDDFSAYPNGSLAGLGMWIATPFGYDPLIVQNHALIGTANNDLLAALDGNAWHLDLTRPWSMAFTVGFAGPLPSPVKDSYCYIQVGSDIGPQNAVLVEINAASGGADHARVYLTDDLSHLYLAVVPFAFGVRHVVTITWDGTIHRAYLDGVQVAAGLLRNPATLTTKYIALVIGGLDTATRWTISNFQFAAKATL